MILVTLLKSHNNPFFRESKSHTKWVMFFSLLRYTFLFSLCVLPVIVTICFVTNIVENFMVGFLYLHENHAFINKPKNKNKVVLKHKMQWHGSKWKSFLSSPTVFSLLRAHQSMLNIKQNQYYSTY